MKVFVTGGCGFLGTHICLFYAERGADVIAYDSLAKHEFSRNPYMRPEARNYNKDILTQAGVHVVVEDIRNKSVLMKYIKDCDYICHTAAQPAMTISWEDPELDFSTNSTGTFNVLDVARQLKIPIAVCSSIHTYGPDKINSEIQEERTRYIRNPIAIDENEPLLQGVVTPLHASKRCNEIYTQSFIDTYGLKAACFRLTGIYGPYQFGGEDHGWVGNFSIKAVMGEPITIFGTGKQIRDVLYASDVAEAFHAFYKTQKPGIYTIGGGNMAMLSLLESIDVIGEIIGKKPEIRFDKDRFGDLRYFVADYTKFQKATGWTPKVEPNEGIKNLISWIRENENLFYKK
jgi:CDP-paratose 2-epimerase